MGHISSFLAGIFLLLQTFAAQAVTPLVITRNNDCLPGAANAVVLQEIYQRAAVPISVKGMPAARATHEVMEGSADGEVSRIESYGISHPNLVRVEPAYSRQRISAFYRASSPKTIVSTADLMGHKLGIVRAIQASEDLVMNASDVERVGESRVLVNLLNAGRIEVAVDLADEFKRVQNRSGLPELWRFHSPSKSSITT